jgi:GWxTD domain-containing protein
VWRNIYVALRRTATFMLQQKTGEFTMYRYLTISFVSLGIFPLLLSLTPDEKIGFGYYHFNRAALLAPQQVRLDSITTEKEYFAALDAADSLTFKWNFEYPFLLLLPEPQRQYYFKLRSMDDRKDFIQSYWKIANPNPVLPANDWLLNFIQRHLFVRKNFSHSRPPYFDDRGKYYLKYGRPVFRYEDAGGMKKIGLFNSDTVFNAIKRSYSFKLEPEKYYMVTANESWSYENVMPGFVVHFMKQGNAYREIKSLEEVLATQQRKNVSWQWLDLVKERAVVLPQVWVKIAEFETNVKHVAFGGNVGLLAADLQNPNERIFKIIRDKAPVAAYDPIHSVNRLRFSNVVSQFRDLNGTTRLEVALLSPLKKNLFKKVSRHSRDTLDIEYRGLLRDWKFDPVAEERASNEFPAKLAALSNFPNAVGNLTIVALPQSGELMLQVKDVRQDKIGFARQTINIRNFSGHELMISDIQFLTEATNATQRQILPVFTKLNTAVAPYPFEKIQKNIPLLCYFEIYNLKSAGVIDNFEVVYKVISEKSGGKNIAVSVRYTRPVTDDTAPELIGIDLHKVPKGAHRLEITVTAMNNRNITSNIQKEIQIED